MGRCCVIAFITICFLTSVSYAQDSETDQLRFDGFYIAKTKEIVIPSGNIEIYTYLKFYEDGTVVTQAVSAFDPEKVAKWFGKDGEYEKMATYIKDGAKISFSASNKSSKDRHLEGALTNIYVGFLNENGQLELEITYPKEEPQLFIFEFTDLK